MGNELDKITSNSCEEKMNRAVDLCTLSYPLPSYLKDFDFNGESTISDDIARKHSWNPGDRSMNMIIDKENPYLVKRVPRMQSTDCIRTRQGYERGIHIFCIDWPQDQRGTHAAIGVGTRATPLHHIGYVSLVGCSEKSWGWEIVRNRLRHAGNQSEIYPFLAVKSSFKRSHSNGKKFIVGDRFFMILNMNEGTLSFFAGGIYFGIAFDGLCGQKLYPILSCVHGKASIQLKYYACLDTGENF